MALEADIALAGKINKFAWTAFIAAFAAPIVIALFGHIGPGQSGYIVGNALGVSAFGALIAWAMYRKSDEVSKSRARLVVSILCLGVVVYSSGEAWQENYAIQKAKDEMILSISQNLRDADKGQVSASPALPPAPTKQSSRSDKLAAFMKGMQVHFNKFAQDSVALNKEFEALNFANMLAPQSLVNPNSVNSSRATIARYRTLIRYRQEMLSNYVASVENYMQGFDIGEYDKQEALNGFRSRIPATRQLYKELDDVQLAVANAIVETLDFADKNRGAFSVENGQLLFQKQEQLDRYNQLMARIQDAALREQQVTDKVNQAQTNARQHLANEFKIK